MDGFSRGGRYYEKELFEINDWSIIDNFLQNVELINNSHTSQFFINRTLTEIKEKCDCESYKYFTEKINFYSDFQKVVEIIKKIQGFTTPESDTIWAGFDNIEELTNELSENIEKLEFCDFETLEKLKGDFLPTCTYQELSLPNGWGDEYIGFASEFDNLYEIIIRNKAHNKGSNAMAGKHENEALNHKSNFWSKLKSWWL